MLETDFPSNEQYISALDIGSNSFHFVLARLHNENLQILHSEKYPVKLAEGLSAKNILSEEAITRGLDALKRVAPIAAKINKADFKVVATYTLRSAVNVGEFLSRAAQVFPYDIEVISGHEEARLVYQGASHYLPSEGRRLVIDIGGGSTECIIGEGEKIYALDSLNIGCVSTSQLFFPEQKITKKNFNQAIANARSALESIKGRFLKIDWQNVTGTSGSIKSIYHIINANQALDKPINLAQLLALQSSLLAFDSFDDIELAGLKEGRKGVICAGVSILIALFKTFEITELTYCAYALREGVLFEALEKRLHTDIHQRTIASLVTRFGIDSEQVNRVSLTAQTLYSAVKKQWKLSDQPYKDMLMWAIQLHEIGVDINTSSFHKHGKYIIENLDLPGFNKEQSQAISWLVGSQRKKIVENDSYHWYLLSPVVLDKILCIFRLSCLFNKQRQLTPLPMFTVKAKLNEICLYIDTHWQAHNPSIVNDLLKEQAVLEGINIALTLYQVD